MRAAFKFIITVTVLSGSAMLLSSFLDDQQNFNTSFSFPYKKAGLTQREAAAHLLSRFTFGEVPGQVDEVVSAGLENWFQQQLSGALADDSLEFLLSGFDALKLTNAEIANTYPKPAQVLRMSVKDGVINRDSIDKSDKKEYRQQLAAYMQQKGLKPQQELFRQFFNQKILRAANTNNQLQEVLTDFWFNHFNVSMTKNDCAAFIPNYERDVIRPHVFGRFEDILLATAKSPAMLLYLDNFSSSGAGDGEGAADNKPIRRMAQANDSSEGGLIKKKLLNAKKSQGLNENYAREVMELHTLGVDGGYTQQDVTQAARVLTGWTIYPFSDYGLGSASKKLMERVGEDRLAQRGFVHEGDFLFAMSKHDIREKKILGKIYPANGGYQEGVELLKMLAHQQATARFISRKIAVRFVSDNPPQSLVDRMTKTFLSKDGDIRQVLITMASSPEFWSKESLREKTKSPFELVISTVRSVHARIGQPYQLYSWISKMGQKLYYYQAPTGFPDKGQYWINTGALLNRMNFGLAFASQRIPGISFDLVALNNHHEPESAEAALVAYSKIMMPERNLEQTIKRLTPLLNDPDLVQKVDEAAAKAPATAQGSSMQADDVMASTDLANEKMPKVPGGNKSQTKRRYAVSENEKANNSMLSQVVGIIIGSPEFQRR